MQPMGRPRQEDRLTTRARRCLVGAGVLAVLVAGTVVTGGRHDPPRREVRHLAAAQSGRPAPATPGTVPEPRVPAAVTRAPQLPGPALPRAVSGAGRGPVRAVGIDSTPKARGDGVWAVVIGINDYPGTRTDLRAAVRDASAMTRALQGYDVPASHQVVLTERQATTGRILRALDWLVANAGPDATAVFFFAGHVKHLGRDSQAMVGADGGLVGDLQLAARLDRLQAARTWLVFATCYGGGFVEALRPGRILTAAADGRSLAYEDSGLGHSYLVEYMVRQAMVERRADGSVEVSFAYAARAIRRDHPNRVPVQYDQLPGELALGRRTTTTTAPAARPCPLQVGALVTCAPQE